MNIDPNDFWRQAAAQASAALPQPMPVSRATPMQQALAAALLGQLPAAPQAPQAPMPNPALTTELPRMASGAPVPLSAYRFTAQDYARALLGDQADAAQSLTDRARPERTG
jgi:hypothetical protein